MTSDLEAIERDLATLTDLARWAHSHGWWKEGHGLDAEHGSDLSKSEAERLAGPTFDIQVGNHPARVAYQHASTTVRRVDVLLAACLVEEGAVQQPPLSTLTIYSRPDELVQAAACAKWRASKITRPHRRLTTARSALDRAVRGLNAALGAGTNPPSPLRQNPCRTCTIRDREPKKAECATCAKWRLRHNGAARPVELDLSRLSQARAAQARRMARGEGWGAA